MNFQFYVEKLKESGKFKEFIKKNKKALLFSGFFINDKVGEDNKQHFDFYIPGKKKMFSFQLEKDCEISENEIPDNNVPEKVDMNVEFEFNDIEEMIKKRMDNEKIKNKIQKLLFSLQSIKGKPFLIGTVFVSMYALLRVNIDLSKMEIIDFQKKSFFDMIKVSDRKDNKDSKE